MKEGAVQCDRCKWTEGVFMAQEVSAPPQFLEYGTRPNTPKTPDPTLKMLLPIGRSLLAIAAGYFGLVSILLVPAPIALILGLLAIQDIRKHPDKLGMGRAIFGVVMGGIFSLVGIFMLVNLLANFEKYF